MSGRDPGIGIGMRPGTADVCSEWIDANTIASFDSEPLCMYFVME
jgi:hypothetical protein